MEAQPPIFLLKPRDSLPLVDVASTVAVAEIHLTGHDQLDRQQGGSGVIGRLDCSYYDSLGQGLEPARTADGKIELILTEQRVEIALLNEIVQHGFNALRAEAVAQSPASILGLVHADQNVSEFTKKWPSSDSVERALRPPDQELKTAQLSADLAMRFLAPSVIPGDRPGDLRYRGSFLHNCWHIAKGICLNCPH
jgi:hypothetical protein